MALKYAGLNKNKKENKIDLRELWRQNLQGLAAEQMDISVYGQRNEKEASAMTQLIACFGDYKNSGARNSADIIDLGGRVMD